MRLIARIMGYGSLVAAGLLYFRVRSMHTALLWPVRLIAGGLAFPLALIGLSAARQGWQRKDGAALWSGLVGAALTAWYIRRVSAEGEAFDEGLGTDWRARITPGQRTRMLKRRWWPQLTTVHDPRIHPDVVYHTPTDSPSLTCDIWQPPWDVRPSGLAYIYVHGGGWCYLHKGFNTQVCFRHLAAQGHVVMDIDYRLAPAVQLETMLGDIKQAIVWMKQHGAKYGVNPECIVLGGGSAGAHLALMAAYTPNHPQLDPPGIGGDTSVRGVVAFYPPVDLYALYQHGARMYRDDHPLSAPLAQMTRALGIVQPGESFIAPPRLLTALLGDTPDHMPARYHFASPLSHVGAHCPPTLLLHGADDCVVPVSHSRVLRNALRAQGVEVVQVEYPHADHSFDLALPEISPSAQAALYDLQRFLALVV